MNDLISRQEVKEILRTEWIRLFPMELDPFIFLVMEKIESIPSAQPETAKRIVGKSRSEMTFWYQCGMCNEPVDAQDNFCRGCGRRLTDG